MAKRVQISVLNADSWSTFPGSKADINYEGAQIKDTVFGQDFQSDQTGLISWSINTNGVFKGFAGYVAKILKSGTPTVMTAEAMSVVSGKTYQITAATKRVIDRLTAVTVYDDAVAVDAADIESISYLFGRVTFTSGYTPTGPITLTGKYLPMSQIGSAQSFTLTQTAATNDNSKASVVQANGGFRTFEAGLRTVTLAIKGVYDESADFKSLLLTRAEMVIEINPDGDQKSVARGWFKPNATGQSGDVGGLEDESLTFSLAVPAQEDIDLPFTWLHASDSTLNLAIRKALDAWDSGDLVDVNYLPDGENGLTGEAVVTDVSLSSGLEAMNDFSVKFQGSGAPGPYT